MIRLKYGDSELSFEKSPDTIGLKPFAQHQLPQVRRMLESQGISPEAGLGSFQLARVASNEMETALDELRERPLVRTGSHVYYTSQDAVPFVPTGELRVLFHEGTSTSEMQQVVGDLSLQIVEARSPLDYVLRTTRASDNPIKTCAQLQEYGSLVKIAEPDLVTPASLYSFIMPADPLLGRQWHLENLGQIQGSRLGLKAGADARVVAAWRRAQSLGSPSVVVAVIDDGFDLAHPDVGGRTKVVAPRDFTRGNASPLPDFGDWHGTACAGVAVGNANGVGIVGAAPGCRLMPVRWGESIDDRQIESWFAHVRTQGAAVVSCSWGVTAQNFVLSSRQSEAIRRCAREGRGGKGCVIVFAAGNENRDVNNPAGNSVCGFAIHPDVIAVAASNSLDGKAHYSNFGKEISICAPSSGAGGWGITTADVRGRSTDPQTGRLAESGYDSGDFTQTFGGTSSATPLVAGICGLILSVKPELTAKEVKALLEQTARKIGPSAAYVNGRSVQFGAGCVNAQAAIEQLMAPAHLAPQRMWGEEGHKTTNAIAVSAMADGKLRRFMERQISQLEAHAMDADNAKNHDPKEKPRHFFDFDEYGEFPFPELPEDFDEAVAKFSEKTVRKNGIVPWQVEITYKELIQAMKAQDAQETVRLAAWLGHYVGDCHVPFHTTANHDGQLTGQKGLHSYFESTVLSKFVAPSDIKPKKTQSVKLGPVHKLAFEWARESHLAVQTLLLADRAARDSQGNRNIKQFALVARPVAIDRLTKGSGRLAQLWQSAWLEAGSPDLDHPVVAKDMLKSMEKRAHEKRPRARK